jgi:chromosome segregation ATPase
MGELQRLEAKHADLNHMLTEADGEIKNLQTKLYQHTKQMTQLEKTSIPSLEREIASVSAHIQRLKEEMTTDLTSTLSEEEREMLHGLKSTQVDLANRIERQNETVLAAYSGTTAPAKLS